MSGLLSNSWPRKEEPVLNELRRRIIFLFGSRVRLNAGSEAL